jgi:hypothetical protein
MFIGSWAREEREELARKSASATILFEIRCIESLPSTTKKDLTQRAQRSERRGHGENLRAMVVLLWFWRLVVAD